MESSVHQATLFVQDALLNIPNIDTVFGNGNSLLHFAILNDVENEVPKILGRFPSLSIQNDQGLQAIDVALSRGNQFILNNIVKHEYIVKFLEGKSVAYDSTWNWFEFPAIFDNYLEWSDYTTSSVFTELGYVASKLKSEYEYKSKMLQQDLLRLTTEMNTIRDTFKDVDNSLYRDFCAALESERNFRQSIVQLTMSVDNLKSRLARMKASVMWHGIVELRSYNGIVIKLWTSLFGVIYDGYFLFFNIDKESVDASRGLQDIYSLGSLKYRFPVGNVLSMSCSDMEKLFEHQETNVTLDVESIDVFHKKFSILSKSGCDAPSEHDDIFSDSGIDMTSNIISDNILCRTLKAAKLHLRMKSSKAKNTNINSHSQSQSSSPSPADLKCPNKNSGKNTAPSRPSMSYSDRSHGSNASNVSSRILLIDTSDLLDEFLDHMSAFPEGYYGLNCQDSHHDKMSINNAEKYKSTSIKSSDSCSSPLSPSGSSHHGSTSSPTMSSTSVDDIYDRASSTGLSMMEMLSVLAYETSQVPLEFKDCFELSNSSVFDSSSSTDHSKSGSKKSSTVSKILYPSDLLGLFEAILFFNHLSMEISVSKAPEKSSCALTSSSTLLLTASRSSLDHFAISSTIYDLIANFDQCNDIDFDTDSLILEDSVSSHIMDSLPNMLSFSSSYNRGTMNSLEELDMQLSSTSPSVSSIHTSNATSLHGENSSKNMGISISGSLSGSLSGSFGECQSFLSSHRNRNYLCWRPSLIQRQSLLKHYHRLFASLDETRKKRTLIEAQLVDVLESREKFTEKLHYIRDISDCLDEFSYRLERSFCTLQSSSPHSENSSCNDTKNAEVSEDSTTNRLLDSKNIKGISKGPFFIPLPPKSMEAFYLRVSSIRSECYFLASTHLSIVNHLCRLTALQKEISNRFQITRESLNGKINPTDLYEVDLES